MVITDADFAGGPIIQRCNPSFCAMTGYTESELIGQSPRILQGPQTDRDLIADLGRKIRAGEFFEGSTTNYRKDGRPYVVEWNISPVRDADGSVVGFVSIQHDITARIVAEKQNQLLTQEVRRQAERLAAELKAAGRYAESILPQDLDGEVSVSSRHLPALELGGDSFNYLWIDDDHLLVYLIDVSGHGLEPALLSVSVHNLLRTRSMSNDTLLKPEAVLTELNQLFQMEEHDEHYFAMWYGVYQASSRMLRYASAGAPPALLFSDSGTDLQVTELRTTSLPIGMFKDIDVATRTCRIPPGSRALVYSDGACEITLPGDRRMKWGEFLHLASRLAASPGWTLDDLIDELQKLTPSRAFDDDCSLIQLTFN